MINLYQLFSEKARDLLRTCEKRWSGAYVVVSSESRSFKSRDLSLQRVLGVRVFVIPRCLSPYKERHVGLVCFIRPVDLGVLPSPLLSIDMRCVHLL